MTRYSADRREAAMKRFVRENALKCANLLKISLKLIHCLLALHTLLPPQSFILNL